MSRIKKRGLDYFPMNTDFLQDRLVRRIMKREGDASLAVLLQTYCCIYSGEGYYVEADRLFYDDLADCLYQQEPSDVERIINLATEYGLFDPNLYQKYHILTSADIQQQFLFITKRRSSVSIEERYSLLPAEAAPEVPSGDENVAANPASATFQSENSEKVPDSTQSIAQQSIAQQRKENSLLHSSPENGGTEGAGRKPAEERGEEENSFRKKSGGAGKPVRREWTDADISALNPPQDGINRNLDGLIYNLRQYHIPPSEQYAIILKSNFGAIGHPLWKGFIALRESHGKIRLPGHYLLSLCKQPYILQSRSHSFIFVIKNADFIFPSPHIALYLHCD